MRTVYREKRYYCGEYLDAYIYPVFETGKQSGGKRTKRKPSTAAQKKLNQRHREEKLVRLLHANFTPEDLENHLTYRIQPKSDKDAKRELSNYIRRVRRYVKSHGLGKLKYITVTEKGKRGGRYHHHVTISVEKGMDRDVLEQLWTETEGHGYANSRRLQFNEEGLEGLGKYIVKSSIEGKAWTASKNLVDPPPKTRDGRISEKRARELANNPKRCVELEDIYPGYTMSRVETFHNDVNGGYYLAARFYRAGALKKPEVKRRN